LLTTIFPSQAIAELRAKLGEDCDRRR
jgi:hypothetical protein